MKREIILRFNLLCVFGLVNLKSCKIRHLMFMIDVAHP